MRRTEFIQKYCIHATFIGVVEGLKGKEETMGNNDTRVKVAISQADTLEAAGVLFDPDYGLDVSGLEHQLSALLAQLSVLQAREDETRKEALL